MEVLSNERHHVTGRELIAQGHTEQDGEKVEAERLYEQRMPVVLEASHKRNLKRLYRKLGDAGVAEYVNQIMGKANENPTSKN